MHQCIHVTSQQVVKVIWHKAASPPQMDGSVVFARWRQCTPRNLIICYDFIREPDPENPPLESNSVSPAIIQPKL